MKIIKDEFELFAEEQGYENGGDLLHMFRSGRS